MHKKLTNILIVFGLIFPIVGIVLLIRYSSPMNIGNDLVVKFLISLAGCALGLIAGYLYKGIRNREHRTIFISHSMEDAVIARQFAELLRSDKLSVILPEDTLNIGDNLTTTVNEQIAKSDSIIALISPKAARSEWVKRELSIARDKQRKIFPVLLEGTEVPSNIQDILYLKLGSSVDETAAQLKNAIMKEETRSA